MEEEEKQEEEEEEVVEEKVEEEKEVEEGEEMYVSVGDPVSVVCVDQTTGHIVAGAQNSLKYVYTPSPISPVVVCPHAAVPAAGCTTGTWRCCRSAEVTVILSGPSFTFQTDTR